MINYIIQVILFQILFLAVYDLFLSKETFFIKNRFYLVFTAVLSFVLPFLRIKSLQKSVSQEYMVLLPEVVLSPQKVIEQSSWYQNINYLTLLFWVGVVTFFIVFLVKLFVIFRLIYSNETHPKKNYTLVWLPKNSKAFSFFNYIFLGKNISDERQEKIIQHELVHSTQKHSLDLLFFEVIKIVMWFNPMIYLYQKRISFVHEFITDAVVTKNEEKTTYINSLLSDFFQVERISFINQFYKKSLIKKRIFMLQKNKSKQVKQFKYLLLVPVLASMLLYSACANDSININEVAKKQPSIVYVQMGEYNKVFKNGKETYLDYYQGEKTPDWQEITYNDLLPEEKKEYNASVKQLRFKGDLYSNLVTSKLYVKENGRKVICDLIDFSIKRKGNEIESYNETEDVPFAVVDKIPTFNGCKDQDKDCLNKSIANFVKNEFNISLVEGLGLSSGKKRIYVQFKIDEKGSVVDVKARAPHPKLKEEAIRLVNKLPKFKPGEHKGKKVRVGYTLPITFKVE